MERITRNNWPENWENVPAWTEIDDELYEYFLNVMPPRTHMKDYFQAGEPYDHIQFHGFFTGRYLTFIRKGGRCWYLGLQVPGFLPKGGAQ